MFSYLVNASQVFLFPRSDVKYSRENIVFRVRRQYKLRVYQVRCKGKLNTVTPLQNLKHDKYDFISISFNESKEEEACNLWF